MSTVGHDRTVHISLLLTLRQSSMSMDITVVLRPHSGSCLHFLIRLPPPIFSFLDVVSLSSFTRAVPTLPLDGHPQPFGFASTEPGVSARHRDQVSCPATSPQPRSGSSLHQFHASGSVIYCTAPCRVCFVFVLELPMT
jgi:hypothetical protein